MELEPDDALDELASKQATLEALEENRREVRSKLRAVTNSLRAIGAVTCGYDASYFLEPPVPDFLDASIHDRLFRCHRVPYTREQLQRDSALRFAFDPPDATRIEWSLSALGREKCARVFARFDVDGDGAWRYSEFLEYVAALEAAHAHERPDLRAIASHPEVWQMYMSDLFDTDAHGRLTLAGFLLYREAIETATPLEHDLRVLHIAIVWRGLAHMQRLGTLFDAYADADGAVALSAAPFLFAESGVVVPFAELCAAVQRQRLFARCLRFVRLSKRALRLFGYRQQSALVFTNPQLEAEPRLCKPAFLSLLLSSWTPASQTRWRYWVMQVRLQAFAVLRRVQHATAWTFERLRRVAQTGLLRASCLLADATRERGDYVLKCDVGARFAARATLHATYSSDADSAATLHELKYLERGAECFVYVDLQCRSGAKDSDVQWLAQRLSWFLDEYFRDHIACLPHVHRWFVTVPTKLQLRTGLSGSHSHSHSSHASTSPVVRVVVLLRAAADLYRVMQSLGLPSSMQFDHLVQRFALRLSSSHALEELLTSKRLDIGAHWACRAQLDARLNRLAWAQLCRQLGRALAGDAADAADEAALLAHERQLRADADAASQQQQPQPHPTKRSEPLDQQAAASERPHWRVTVGAWLESLADVLGSTHEVSATAAFATASDAVLGSRWLASALSPRLFRFVKHVVTTPGALAAEWRSSCESFRSEFSTTPFAQRAVAALSRTSSRSSAFGADDVAGIEHSVAASFPFAAAAAAAVSSQSASARPETVASARTSAAAAGGDATDPLSPNDAVETDLLELYDMCAKHLQGVSVIRVEAGTSGLTCVLEGWNVCSLLPRVHAAATKRHAAVAHTKSSNSTTSTTNSVSAMPGLSRGR